VPDIKRLDRDKWETLRHLRLTALDDSPEVFLASYGDEERYEEAEWLAEFDRGSWYFCEDDQRPIGLIGAVRYPHMPDDECSLEYIWVSPGHRRSGIASDLVASVLKLLRADQYRTAYLWVLDGNRAAMDLYEKLGFVSTNERHELQGRPGRSEERFMVDLR
jgi:ribosomal protein S18 acetylase RimI-like enzyme